ncbi:MAG TPA: gamma-glutamyltransferase family protein [Rubrivivax sp.]|nr:gamma-glutamyltransferase family protein [Rubrivivax sp.]
MQAPDRSRVLRAVAAAAVAALSLLVGCASPRASDVGACGAPQLEEARDAWRPGAPGAPEIATGYTRKRLVTARRDLVVAAHPLAAQAGCEVLAQGGSAVDAAIAVQMVLNLVEPQSSGIGGGAFMLHYRARDERLFAWDGRETAPAAARANDLRWIDDDDHRPPVPSARASGRSVGTPGLLRMLERAHAQGGRLPWRVLFEPAIRLAEEGFPISPRLGQSIAAAAPALQGDARARALFLQADGSAKPAGTLLRNPALAATLRTLAEQGAQAFYRGAIAAAVVEASADTRGGTATPGRMTLADLAAYRARQREPICTPYRRVYIVCGMPPPSSGGLAVAQVLGMLESFELAALAPTARDAEGGKPSVLGVHLVAEAERLAFADRDRFVADTDFVPLPGGSPARMLEAAYLRQRAALIDPRHSMGRARPGDLGGPAQGRAAPDIEQGTTQISVVDRDGDVVSMTSSIEGAFGAYRMTRAGFLLNNQLTDFSARPVDEQGLPVANRLEPGKRPRSSMAPTLVFRRRADGARGDFLLATGSPGGAAIIPYVTKTLVGVLDWGLDAQQAAALVDFGAFNTPITFVGGEHPNVDGREQGRHDALVQGLRALGHRVDTAAQSSGIATIVRRTGADGTPLYEGGADPRREGLALGTPAAASFR